MHLHVYIVSDTQRVKINVFDEYTPSMFLSHLSLLNESQMFSLYLNFLCRISGFIKNVLQLCRYNYRLTHSFSTITISNNADNADFHRYSFQKKLNMS